jgi:hypothetical protein
MKVSSKDICFIIEDEEDEQIVKNDNETYYARNKDVFKERYLKNVENKRAYQNDYNLINNDKYTEYQKSYYQKRRDTLLESKKEKVTCECGKIVSLGHLTCHKKTSSHTKRLISK